jgi:hypothetical protein
MLADIVRKGEDRTCAVRSGLGGTRRQLTPGRHSRLVVADRTSARIPIHAQRITAEHLLPAAVTVTSSL